MKRAIIILLLAIAIQGCSNDDPQAENVKISGDYTGYFIRSSASEKYSPSWVQITFDSGNYQGSSEEPKYPAICNGRYSVNDTSVEFISDCAWTADFDWTLVLSGSFEVSGNEQTLTLTRTVNGVTDRYKLQKK